MSTNYLNNIGFNALDARDMSSISEFYLERGYLTINQIRYVRKVMMKYWRQLLMAGVEALPIKATPQKAPRTKAIKKASLSEDGTEIVVELSFPKGDK